MPSVFLATRRLGRRSAVAALLSALLSAAVAAPAVAAEPEFVGVLALALEKDVAAQLMLSDDQRRALDELIERREEEVLELALSLRDATPEAREAKLAPYRKQSETEGLKLLDDRQRGLLEQIRVRRAAGASLVEPAIAAQLKLTPEQSAAIAKLAAERAVQMANKSGQEREVLRSTFDRRMFDVLTADQRTAWDKIAGAAPVAVAQAEAAPMSTAQPGAQGDEAVAAQPAAPVDKDNVKLKFNFRYQPWAEVIDWFAEQADLSLLMDTPPPGTLNYTDPRSYTPAEALDLMNGILLTKGYTLVRRDRMLHVVNLEDGIPPSLVPFVPVEKLDSLGDFELVTTLFTITGLTPQDAETELKKLIGPQGSLVVLPTARQLQVTETAGRLRLMRTVLQAAGGLQASAGSIRAFQPVHVAVEDALPLLRQLLNIPPDAFADGEGSVRLAIDPLTGKLLVSGKPERVNQVADIMKAIDVPAPELDGALEQPQLEVYDVGASDPASVLAVLQTLLANHADVRLTTDPLTGRLVALAKPEQHATIKAVLDQMQREARQFEVLRLQFVDPQQAVLAINRLFGGTGETANPSAPKVEADLATRQLLVRGSPTQIEQIRSLLAKMGENVTDGASAEADTSTVRMLPLGSRTVRQALEQMETVWPTLRRNPIRVVTPRSSIEGIHPAAADRVPVEPTQPTAPGAKPQATEPGPAVVPTPANPAPAKNPEPPQPPAPVPTGKSASRTVPVRTASLVLQPAATPPEAAAPADGEPAPIIVAPGPAGVMIASDDVEALNQFEALLNSLASRTMTGGKEFTVFYLENASAASAAESLEAIFGAGGASGGGSLLGDLAGMALGNVGGNLVGAMMGGGAGGPAASISASSTVLIVPDPRLNALIVQASPADLDLMEQLLRVIDRADVPESTVNPRPRLIPVQNTGAAQIAEILREVYQDKLVNANRQRQPSPEELIQMLRGGGRGGAGGGSQRSAAEAQKVAIGVDSRTNSLVVSAAEPLFSEIRLLVETLDQATAETSQSIRIVTLKRSNATTVQKALTAIVGDKASTSKPATDAAAAAATTAPQPQPSSGGSSAPQGMDPRQLQEIMRQRMEMFNQMRGGSGGFPGGGFPGGFPSRSGGDGRSDGGRDGGRDGRR